MRSVPRGRGPLILLSVAAMTWVSGGHAHASAPGAPRYVFRQVGGLALETTWVKALMQDRDGFLWIGTQEGLYRFDGGELVRFGADRGVPDTFVAQLETGPDGAVWMVAGGVVGRFDGLRFRPVHVPVGGAGFPNSPQRLALDRSGRAWLATLEGLVMLEGPGHGRSRRWSAAEGLPAPGVEAVHVAADGTVWFGSGGRVGRLDPASGEVSLLPPTGTKQAIKAVLTTPDGGAWVRTRSKLLRLAPGAGELVVDEDHSGEMMDTAIPALDAAGRIMVPTVTGLWLEEQGGWRFVDDSSGLPGATVTRVLADATGTLWIGVVGFGLVRWAGRESWTAWTRAEGLPHDVIWGLLRGPRGRLWVGTSGGLAVRRADGWDVRGVEDGVVSSMVYKLVAEDDRWVWSLAAGVGLNRYDVDTLEVWPVRLPQRYGRAPLYLAPAEGGGVWIGGVDYLLRARTAEGGGTELEDVPLPPELSTSAELVREAGGALWIAGEHGVGRRDAAGRWRFIACDHGLRSDMVLVLHATSADEAWVGYREPLGLTRIRLVGEETELAHFGVPEGLASEHVWMIDGDSDELWVGGARGLTILGPDGPSRRIDQDDGLMWNDLDQESLLIEDDGTVFVGTSRGLARYRPGAEVPEERPARPFLGRVRLGGVARPVDAPGVTEHESNVFSADLACLALRSSSAVRFRVQLTGVDAEPIETAVREVRYPGLAAGKYRFEVSCRAGDGRWSSEPASYEFTVRPPWWARWWVRGGAALLLLLALFAAIRWRERKAEADRRTLERLVAERSSQLAAAVADLEEASFRDPLTGTRNRRYFASIIDQEVARVRRGVSTHEPNRDLVFFLVDLDHFKSVNDTLGHAAGDLVLVETARRLRSSVRESDLLVRWGGEEFLVVARDTERGEAPLLAQRILEQVGREPFTVSGQEPFRRTCTVGWAALPVWRDEPGRLSHEDVVELADKALYLAKRRGRNQAVGVELAPVRPEDALEARWRARPLEELEAAELRLIDTAGPAPTPPPLGDGNGR